NNPRWSWGSVRLLDGAVFLRVWQDRIREHDGRRYMQVTHKDKVHKPRDYGYLERLDHVEKIRQGGKCYLVMCEAVAPNSSPRKIKSRKSEEVFVAGKIVNL